MIFAEDGFQPATMTMFAAAYIALYASHQLGDYWVQTPLQAEFKSKPGSLGRRACAWHVATYGVTQLVFLLIVRNLIGGWGYLPGVTVDTQFSLTGLFVGLGISLVTHYVADRRWPLRWLAERLGKGDYWDQEGAAAQLDQSWHTTWLFVAAFAIAVI